MEKKTLSWELVDHLRDLESIADKVSFFLISPPPLDELAASVDDTIRS